MSLQSSINAYVRHPCARVYLKGVRCQIPDREGAITHTQAFGQPIAGATVVIKDPPSLPQKKDPIVITWGYDDQYVYGIVGFVTNPQRSAYPREWILTVQDMLWIADFAVESEDGIVLLNETTGVPNEVPARDAVVRLLRDWAGIPESRMNIPELETAPGVPWILGKLSPVAWSSGTSPLQAVLSIANVLGYWVYSDASGVVQMVKITGAPTASAAYAYEDGKNITVNGAPKLSSPVEDVYNQVIVTGANTGVEGAQVRDVWAVNIPYLPDGKHRSYTFNSPLIEYVAASDAGEASCEAIAKRMVREHSRDPNIITGTAKANPLLSVGQTVGLKCARLGFGSGKPFFLMEITTTFGGAVFTQDYKLDGGVGPEGYSLIPPPTAGFTWTLMFEKIYINPDDAEATGVIEVFLDGTSSQAFGQGIIVAYDWTDDSVPPQTGSGPYATFIYPEGHADPQVTLTIHDVTGKTSELTQTIPLAGDLLGVPAKRALNFAADSWYVTKLAGTKWRNESAHEAQAVPPIGAEGSAYADQASAGEIGFITTRGSDAKDLRNTIDYLESASKDLLTGALSEAIGFIWQNERTPTRIWVCTNDGVRLSVDGGATFGSKKTPPVPSDETDRTCRWIVESVDQDGLIDVLAGRYAYTSYDAGEHWEMRLQGPVDSLAYCYVSGFAKHWVGFINCPTGSSPMRSLEGDVCAFPVDTTPEVTSIRAITMGQEGTTSTTTTTDPNSGEPTDTTTTDVAVGIVLGFDEQGRVWRTNATDGNETAQYGVLPD